MEANEQTRFDSLFAQHLRGWKLRGYSVGTIDVYARAVRRSGNAPANPTLPPSMTIVMDCSLVGH